MATSTPAERVRERMRRWMETADLGQREFAADLKKSQVWLQKVLQGENEVRLRHLDDVAHAMHTTASELVREEGDHYVLELSPTEMRLIEKLRRRREHFDALTQLLDLRVLPKTGTKKP